MGVGLAVLGLALGASAQVSVSAEWAALEALAGSGTDVAVDAATWVDTEPNPDVTYVYVAGYVTDANGKQRLAVWRCNADDGPGPNDPEAIFPDPIEYPTIGGHTRATAITVDPSTGDVYVCGSTQLDDVAGNWPVFGSDYNYIVLKLHPLTLALSDDWPGGSVPDGFRLYDHAGLDDKAVDIVVVEEGVPYTAPRPRVCVTGDSADPTGGSDIARLKIEGSTGDFSGSWPAAGAGLPALFPLDARAQCSPVWTGMGLDGGGAVGMSTAWGNPGSVVPTYVGAVGGLLLPGNPSPRRVMVWDGWSWRDMWIGLTGVTEDIASPGSGLGLSLYAGGTVRLSAGSRAGRVVKWNTGAWGNVGGGTSPGTVYALFWCDLPPPSGRPSTPGARSRRRGASPPGASRAGTEPRGPRSPAS